MKEQHSGTIMLILSEVTKGDKVEFLEKEYETSLVKNFTAQS